jgi:hypothetical protein
MRLQTLAALNTGFQTLQSEQKLKFFLIAQLDHHV